jgi:hypothetical protein
MLEGQRLEQIENMVNKAKKDEYKAYDMGCLVSIEFTPGPDDSFARKALNENNITVEEYNKAISGKYEDQYIYENSLLVMEEEI